MRRSWLNHAITTRSASSLLCRCQGTFDWTNVRLATSSGIGATAQPAPPASRPNAQQLSRVVTRLVKAAEQGPDNPMWTTTPDRGRRLDQELIQAVTSSGGPTQRQNFAFKVKKQKHRAQVETEDMFDIPELSGEPSLTGIGDIRAGFFVMSQR